MLLYFKILSLVGRFGVSGKLHRIVCYVILLIEANLGNQKSDLNPTQDLYLKNSYNLFVHKKNCQPEKKYNNSSRHFCMMFKILTTRYTFYDIYRWALLFTMVRDLQISSAIASLQIHTFSPYKSCILCSNWNLWKIKKIVWKYYF
jgi:hypothetical protein